MDVVAQWGCGSSFRDVVAQLGMWWLIGKPAILNESGDVVAQ
jgi:hypothetical protein